MARRALPVLVTHVTITSLQDRSFEVLQREPGRSQVPKIIPARAIKAASSVLVFRHDFERTMLEAVPIEICTLDELLSRCNRRKSAPNSAALWQHSVRSFSIALPIMSSSLGGSRGFKLEAAAGSACRIWSKITAEVGPSNACRPVAIS